MVFLVTKLFLCMEEVSAEQVQLSINESSPTLLWHKKEGHTANDIHTSIPQRSMAKRYLSQDSTELSIFPILISHSPIQRHTLSLSFSTLSMTKKKSLVLHAQNTKDRLSISDLISTNIDKDVIHETSTTKNASVATITSTKKRADRHVCQFFFS